MKLKYQRMRWGFALRITSVKDWRLPTEFIKKELLVF